MIKSNYVFEQLGRIYLWRLGFFLHPCFFLSYFWFCRMNEMENPLEGPSVTGVNNDASTSADVTLPNHPKRSSKKCKKCGNIVKNLSRHQDEVHGMSKIKRKLDACISKEKKAPKRRVQFCPLSPCKRAETPIFQFDKHLQRRIHSLKPNTPAYLAALAQPPRASLSKVENCLKKERKKRSENKREHQQGNAEENQTEREVKDETGARNEYDTTEVERIECSRKNIPEYNDDDYKELTRRAQNIIERRAKSIKRKKPKKAKPGRMKNEVDSDEECNRLANEVWVKNLEVEERALDKAQPKRGKTIRDNDEDYTQLLRGMCNRNYEESRKDDCGQESADGNIEDNSRRKSEEDSDDSEDSNEENEDLVQQDVVVLSDSDDCNAGPHYIYEENAGSEVSSQSEMSRESSSLFEEGEGLMMELVEVVGEGNIDEGSFLDREPNWRDAVKDFKDGRLSEGHVFKTPQESTKALMRLYEASGDIKDVFRDVLDEDQSDDDDVLDTEEREDAKTGSQAGDNDEVTGELLGDFYKWLIDVDGGYRSDKMAQQYKSQVESVIKRLKMKEMGTNDVQENPTSV